MSAGNRWLLVVAGIATGVIAVFGPVYLLPPEAMVAAGFGDTRLPEAIDKIDSLTNPVAVSGWTERGIRLADGRIVGLPGIIRMPEISFALAEALRQGVEISRDGRIFGLVRVWHWCGNDPIGKHVVRVDISRLLMFLDEGQHAPVNPPPCAYPCEPDGGRFTENGWDPGEFRAFMEWNEAIDSPLGSQAI